MSDTDIYKSREPVPAPNPTSQKPRRRRRSSRPRFDEEPVRKRRGKNSGLRRVLHLLRKAENEKYFWWGLLVVIVVLLITSGLWQYYVTQRSAQEYTQELAAGNPEPARSAAE